MPSHAGQAISLLMVAAEASGDQHGAALVRALRERFPQLQVYGLGGDHMRAAGVETLFDVQALNVVGVVEILAKVPSGLRMAYQLLRAAARRGTQVAVLIDAPGFNLTLARLAKRAGLSVVYYISPQIWAWRQRRVKRVARYVDKMLTLFPFEVPFYTAAGVDAEYVGHPLLRPSAPPASTRAGRAQPGTRRAGPYYCALTWESPSGTPESSAHHARRLPAHPTASARRTRDYTGGANSRYGRSPAVPDALPHASDGYLWAKSYRVVCCTLCPRGFRYSHPGGRADWDAHGGRL